MYAVCTGATVQKAYLTETSVEYGEKKIERK